jgi:hypothetical protein
MLPPMLKDNDSEQNERQRYNADRTFKHIWFLPTRKAKTKNQKSLNFANTQT